MRVTITPKEGPYRLECVVEFSEEEKAIINKHKLEHNFIALPDGVEAAIFQKKTLFGSKPDPAWKLVIATMMARPNFSIPGPDPATLRQYQEFLYTSFSNLKDFIMDNAEVGQAETREF